MATSYMSYSDELEYYARREAKEEGIGIGIDIGEQKKALEIAIDLLDVLDDKTIALKTGFSEDEIKKLRIEHGK